MIHDPPMLDYRPFDPGPYDARYFELGPYEIEDADRITIRRGETARAAPMSPTDAPLTGQEIGKLAVAGAITGTAIAFIIDPAGAAAALLSIVGL